MQISIRLGSELVCLWGEVILDDVKVMRTGILGTDWLGRIFKGEGEQPITVLLRSVSLLGGQWSSGVIQKRWCLNV